MIKKILIILVILAILATMGLGVFLAPDNLAGCRIDEGPGGSGCEKADAIVVVSGGDTAARTSEAVRLYKAGWAKVLIMSGAAADKTGPSNAAVMRDQAEHEGVPRSHILLDIKSNNTEENAHEVAQIIKAHKFSSIIAVTSGYHQRRVGLELSRPLAGAVLVRNHPVAQDKQWNGLWWTTPSGWQLAITELVGIIKFYTRGE